NARTDLSRRAITYNMQGLSFREYLLLEENIQIPVYSLQEILQNHTSIARHLLTDFKPFQYLENYLKYGYYPFFKEEKELYYHRLGEVIQLMLEIELPLLRSVDIAYVSKIKEL